MSPEAEEQQIKKLKVGIIGGGEIGTELLEIFSKMSSIKEHQNFQR